MVELDRRLHELGNDLLCDVRLGLGDDGSLDVDEAFGQHGHADHDLVDGYQPWVRVEQCSLVYSCHIISLVPKLISHTDIPV